MFKDDAILLVEDDNSLRFLLQDELESEGYRVLAAASAEEAATLLEQEAPAVIISDLRLPGASGMSLLSLGQRLEPRPAMLIITAFGTVRQAVDALKAGADDFLTKPLDMDHLLLSVNRLLESRRLRGELGRYRELMAEEKFHGMIMGSAAMHNLREQIRRIATASGPVLILGESGTGKELVARAIHEESDRREGPYLTVNCGGIPSELMESEFFGHTSGAFTGARGSRAGLFQQADGGTLLLDELGEMPLPLQAKLLRVLQDGQVRPVGSDHEHHVDLRILAATNRDLARAVEEGAFREDLYFRLETFAIQIPPLRERGDDILALANHFLARFAARRNVTLRGFSDAAVQKLRDYPFPGNVRELENAVERAVTFCDGELIEPVHLPRRIADHAPGLDEPAADRVSSFPWLSRSAPLMTMEELQRRYLDHVLEQTGGNKRRAAQILGITRRTLYRWLEGGASRSSGGEES